MASMGGIRCCVGGNSVFCRLSETDHRSSGGARVGPVSVRSDNWSSDSWKRGRSTIAMAMKTTAVPARIPVDDPKKKAVVHEKMDVWMRDSVAEIVKNLKEAPLLVQVYGDSASPKVKTEKAVEENWPIVVDKWNRGESPSPDGVIFVEQLEGEDDDEEEEGGERRKVEEDMTRAWGIVVQGKGADCGPVCYLLKTSSAGSGSGLGLLCTHFCLMRVKSFRETARSQLKNCWLLQAQGQRQ